MDRATFSTHSDIPLVDTVTPNGDGTFTHTLTPKQESAYVAGWRKITSLSDLHWATTSQEKHHRWTWDDICKDCGRSASVAPQTCAPPQPTSVHKFTWNGKGILCKDCGCGIMNAPKTCPDCQPKRHDLFRDPDKEEYCCLDCRRGWDDKVLDPKDVENEICEGPHAEHSTQHSRREGTHSG